MNFTGFPFIFDIGFDRMNPRSVNDIEEGCITFITDRQSPGKHYAIETDKYLIKFMEQMRKKEITNITIVTTPRIKSFLIA